MLDRTTLDYLPGETVGGRYNRLVQYAQTFDWRFAGGVASVTEVDRVEKAIATFKQRAAEKEAAEARKAVDTPLGIANAGLHDLWLRADRAQQEIAEAQAKLGRQYESPLPHAGSRHHSAQPRHVRPSCVLQVSRLSALTSGRG
jgi:hypothetical protein